MNGNYKLRPHRVLVLSLILFVGVTVASYQSTERFLQGNQDVAESRDRQDELSRLIGAVTQADRTHRGYLLTGDSKFLDDYNVAASDAMVQDYEIRRRPHGPDDQALIKRMDELVRGTMARFQREVGARQKALDTANDDVNEGLAEIDTMNEIRRLFLELRTHEQARLEERLALAKRSAQHTFVSAVLLLMFTAALVVAANVLILRNLKHREAAEQKAAIAQEKTAVWAQELENTNKEFSFLNDFTDGLGICSSFEEVYETVSGHFHRALPGVHGVLSVINNSQTFLETASSWNPLVQHDKIFAPDDCRALRRGSVYAWEVGSPNLNCIHAAGNQTNNHLCMPLIAQGETLGTIYLEFGATKWSERQQRFANKMAESTAMKLANVKLRDKLKSQAIRDPLTGIFNRRYMEESLLRELSRAERRNIPVGVIMIDLDHFKRFNDSFGHEAGDRVLLEVSTVLRDSFRSEDIVCRFGGEELLVIVPEMKKEEVVERADHVRVRIRQIHIEHRNEVLGGITASFGVAAYPEDARTQTELINKADIALYSAKHTGRDRVVAFSRSIELNPAETIETSA